MTGGGFASTFVCEDMPIAGLAQAKQFPPAADGLIGRIEHIVDFQMAGRAFFEAAGQNLFASGGGILNGYLNFTFLVVGETGGHWLSF